MITQAILSSQPVVTREVPVPPTAQLVVQAAVDAKDAAETARDAAATSESNANTYKNDAQTAKTAAETARDAAATSAGTATGQAGIATATAASLNTSLKKSYAADDPTDISHGILSIIFDDGYVSAFNTIKPMFESRGIRCGFAINGINADGGDSSKFLTASQLVSLEKAGFEVGNHTWGNTTLTTNATPYPTAETEIRTNAKWLRGLGIKCPFYVAVSSVLDPVYDSIPPLDHAFAFTTYTGGNWGDNAKNPLPITDPYDLKRSSAYALYSGGGNTLTRLTAIIDALVATGGVVFLYDHDPENVSGNPASMPTADWETFLDYAIAQGVRIEAPSVAFDLVNSTQIKAERIDHIRKRVNRSLNVSTNLLRDTEMNNYGLTSATDWWADVTTASGAFSLSQSGVGFEQPLQLNLTGGSWLVDDEVVLKNRTASFDSLERLGLLQFAIALSSGSSGANTKWAITVGVNILDAVTPSTVLATAESIPISINSRRRRFSVPDGITSPSYTNGVIVEVFVRVKCLVSATSIAIACTKPKLETNDEPTPYVRGIPSLVAGSSSSTMSNYFASVSLTNNAYVQMTTPALTTDFASVTSTGLFTAIKSGTVHLDAIVKVDPAVGASANGCRLIMSYRKNGSATNLSPQEATGVGTRLILRLHTSFVITAGDTFSIHAFQVSGSAETTVGGGTNYSNYTLQYSP